MPPLILFPPRLLLLLLLLLLPLLLQQALTVTVRGDAATPVLSAVVDHAIRFDRLAVGSSKTVTSFGSQESLLRGSIVVFDPTAIASYGKQTVFIPTELHITQTQWKKLVALPVRGIVAATSPSDTRNEELLQHYLSSTSVAFPVYFLPHDGEIARKLYETLSTIDPSEFAVISVGANKKAVEPVANTSVTGIHIFASLTLKTKEAKAALEMPRLLVTAAFDTLGVAPSGRTTGGASGTVAALELWRRFNADAALAAAAAEEDQVAVSPYGISILLSNTARFNYAGTSQWVTKRQEGELDRYLLVLCLDELLSPSSDDHEVDDDNRDGSAVSLFLHVHEYFAKNPQYLRVKEIAETVAARHGIALTILAAKTNYHHYDIRFEHEVLAHRQILAVTISSSRTYRVDQPFRGGRVPLAASLNTTGATATAMLLNRRVDFVHAFAQAILGHSTAEESRPWVGSAAYMMGLLLHAAESQRNPVAQGGAGQLKYAKTLETHMKHRAASSAPRRTLSTSVSLSTYRVTLPGMVLVGPYEQVMNIFVAKSIGVELAFLAVTVVIVGSFALLEFGPSKTWRLLLDCIGEEAKEEEVECCSKQQQQQQQQQQ